MNDAKLEVSRTRNGNEFFSLADGHRKRLLRQNVLAKLQGLSDERVVTHRSRGHGYDIDVLQPVDFGEVRGLGEMPVAVFRHDLPRKAGRAIDDADNVEVSASLHDRHVPVGGNPTRPDDGGAKFVWSAHSRVFRNASGLLTAQPRSAAVSEFGPLGKAYKHDRGIWAPAWR